MHFYYTSRNYFMDHITTQRMPTATPLEILRNVRNRTVLLTLRRANNGFLTKEQKAELERLHKRETQLNREYDEARRTS